MRLTADDDNKKASPLMNFLGFLLQVLERDAAPLFEVLRAKYAPSLRRAPMLLPLLDRVGKAFFGLAPVCKPQGMGGMGGMMQMMQQMFQ